MLSIYYGDMSEAVYNTSVYFKNTYEDEWILDQHVRQMIEDVDKSIVIDAGVIDSPVLGKIPPEKLSGGVKTLILIDKDDSRIYNASTCGDNCAKWILQMAQDRDITINLRHLMRFGKEAFEIKVLNTGEIAHNSLELLEIAAKLI